MINKHNLYYLLGFGFLDLKAGDKITLSTLRRRGKVMEDIHHALRGTKIEYEGTNIILSIEEEEITSFLYRNGIGTPKRYMPSIDEEYAWSFIAGYFDAYGELSFKRDNLRLYIQSPITEVIEFIAKYWQVRTTYADKVVVNGYKALDACGSMYKNVSIRDHKFNLYMDILNLHPDKAMVGKMHNFEYLKLHPSAVPPQKVYVTDSGFDLHILEMSKLYGNVYQGKTELAIKPILGYAFDINGRSNLPKNGWLFLQGTGICDRSYTGGVQATFMKLNDEPMPKMPWKALQVIPREAPLHAEFVESKNLGESFRGAGGFGSTNRK